MKVEVHFSETHSLGSMSDFAVPRRNMTLGFADTSAKWLTSRTPNDSDPIMRAKR